MFIPLWRLTTQTNAPELNLSTLRTGRGRAHLIRTTHVTLSFDCERSKVLHVIGVAVLQAARLPSSFSSLRRLVHFYCLLLLLYSSALQPGGRGAAITHTHTHTCKHPSTHALTHPCTFREQVQHTHRYKNATQHTCEWYDCWTWQRQEEGIHFNRKQGLKANVTHAGALLSEIASQIQFFFEEFIQEKDLKGHCLVLEKQFKLRTVSLYHTCKWINKPFPEDNNTVWS